MARELDVGGDEYWPDNSSDWEILSLLAHPTERGVYMAEDDYLELSSAGSRRGFDGFGPHSFESPFDKEFIKW